MAAFQEPDCYQRLDFRLLQASSAILYCDPAILADDVQWFKG